MKDVPGGQGGQVGIIAPGGPAERAGIHIGDVIVGIGGRPMADSNAVVQALAALSPGEKVSLTVLRSGRTLELQAVLGEATPSEASPSASSVSSAAAALLKSAHSCARCRPTR